MAAEQVPGVQGTGKQHVHHAYIWLEGIKGSFWALFVLAIGLFSSMASILDEDPELAFALASHGMLVVVGILVLVILFCGLSFGFRALAYKNLYYELTETELGVYSGIISKKRVHVPFQKIQSVDLKASLIQRIFGLCTVVIDTAGGASNKAVMVPCLQKGTAELLRNDLYALKRASLRGDTGTVPMSPPAEGNVFDVGNQAWQEFGGIFASDPVVEAAPSFEYGLTNKEIFLTGVSNSSGVVVGIISAIATAVLTIIIPLLSIVGEGGLEPVGIDSSQAMESVVGSILAIIVPVAIAALIGVALFIWAIASLTACLQFGGFRARRRGTRIEVERGLLQHNAISLDIERVQSVIIKQSFIRRLAGYCEVSLGKVNAMEAGSSGKDANAKAVAEAGFVIHPFVKLSKVDAILHGMVPEYADLPTEQVRVAPAALRRGLIRRCILFGGGFWIALITAVVQAIVHAAVGLDATTAMEAAEALGIVDIIAAILYVLAVIILAFEIAGTLLWYRDSHFAKGKRMVTITNGGLSRNTVALPKTKVQFGTTKTNPLQRRAHTTTICATTAAGIGGTFTTLIDVTAEVADAWMEWLEPIGQQSQRQA